MTELEKYYNDVVEENRIWKQYKETKTLKMYNEDRDHILVEISNNITKKLIDIGFREDFIDELLFDDETWNKFELLFEPYTNGWRNYN